MRPGAAYGKLAPVRPPADGGSGRGLWRGPGFGGRRGAGGFRDPAGGLGRRRGPLRAALAKGSVLRQFDWLLLAAVLALSALGTMLVWSATQAAQLAQGGDPRTYLYKQLLNIIIGLILMFAVSALNYRRLRALAPLAYAAACLGLVAVLSPIGTTVNGAHSWISLPGGFQIEPSEYAKLAVILIGASALAAIRSGENRPRLRAVAIALACAALPVGLVLFEPDLGVTILLLVIVAGMVVLSGVRLRWLAVLAIAAAGGAYAAIRLHLLKSYQLHRLSAFSRPSADPTGAGYSAAQSKAAIATGGMTGQGLFHGQMIAGNFVPEQHTDFIFAVAGEELGFVGAVVIIGLLAVLLLRALRIAARADDQFGMLVAAGVAIWFAVQCFINIAMTMGLMPVTGLPLPFVSYGGSAMFADMIAIGMLQSVHRHRTVFGPQ